MITTAVRTSLNPIYTNPSKIFFKMTLKGILTNIFVVYIMSTPTHVMYMYNNKENGGCLYHLCRNIN